MTAKVFGVFSGGGVKGAAFLGAVEEAQKSVQFVGWGGTSAGSIVASLLACGYSIEELKELLLAAPYAEFFRISKLRLLLFGRYRGLIDPAPLLRWLRTHIGKKFPNLSRVNFEHLRDDQYLKIVAANISTQQIAIYSKAVTPKQEIAQAVLASSSFPLLFPAVRDGEDEIVDGGIFSNFPMWLFQNEHEDIHRAFVPVLGFALISSPAEERKKSVLSHVYSIVESVLAAQERVQDKYIDAPRSASVIRIDVGTTPTFVTSQSREKHDSLLLAGRDAAAKYFERATENYGRRMLLPSLGPAHQTPIQLVSSGNYREAVSAIARQHIIHGGVARDSGPGADRVLVKYYIDLMEAVTDHEKLEALALTVSEHIKSLGEPFDRIVGTKKGNIILSYAVAQKLGKPLSVFKSDMSYKMGQPFDGYVNAGERIIVVDDIASDAQMLLNPIRHLHFYHAVVKCVVTLLERIEGDARLRIIQDKGVPLHTICRVDDKAIEHLITGNTPFQCN